MCSAILPRFNPHLFTQSATCKIRLQNVFLYWLIKIKIKRFVVFVFVEPASTQARSSSGFSFVRSRKKQNEKRSWEIASALFFRLEMLTTVSVRSHFADPWNISKLRYLLLIAHTHSHVERSIASCIASTTDLFFLWTKIREQNKLKFIFTIEIASNCSEKNDDGKRRRNIYETRSLNSTSSLSLMSCAETRSASLCSIGVKENLKNSLWSTWRRQPPTQCFSLSHVPCCAVSLALRLCAI